MKNFSNRLNRIEDELVPKARVALCFGRYRCIKEDSERQQNEYYELHGKRGSVTFYTITDYANRESESYEDFIKRSRKESGNGNLFSWWPKNEEGI